MGRRAAGETVREHKVNFRLNDAEKSELDEKRAARGLETSDYFRTLMKEDGDGDQP